MVSIKLSDVSSVEEYNEIEKWLDNQNLRASKYIDTDDFKLILHFDSFNDCLIFSLRWADESSKYF